MNDTEIIMGEADIFVRRAKSLRCFLKLSISHNVKQVGDDVYFEFWFEELTKEILCHLQAFKYSLNAPNIITIDDKRILVSFKMQEKRGAGSIERDIV